MAEGDGDTAPEPPETAESSASERTETDEFGRQGWLLVAGIFAAFVLVPLAIYLNARGIVALPFRFSFLVLPLLPAILLAILAVYVTSTP